MYRRTRTATHTVQTNETARVVRRARTVRNLISTQ